MEVKSELLFKNVSQPDLLNNTLKRFKHIFDISAWHEITDHCMNNVQTKGLKVKRQ